LHRKWRFHLSSNFSLGVNIFFEINEYLAKMMAKLDHYSIEMEEIHHTQKLDAPSGTAISLAKVIENSKYTNWTLDKQLRIKFILKQKELQLFLEHKVTYNSSVDSISIEHTAHNREGFALGAIIAAEWIVGKQGTFTMKDVLELK
jgi:4-hydroxy-tetrahydrodipicolinate reductase